VRWGVDAEVFRRDEQAAAALRARLGLAGADRVILSPRILQPLYNVHLLLDALPGILAEVPIEFHDRTLGRSKMSSRIIVEALVLVTWWGLQGRRRARRKRREPLRA